MTNSWEQDPDAWKDDSETPRVKKGKFRFLEATIAVKPLVPTVLMPEVGNPESLLVKDRDALKNIVQVYDKQQALTEENELFQYSAERNLWIRIPWEKC